MGATIDQINKLAEMYEAGLLRKGASIADIGCQQLRGQTREDIEKLADRFGVKLTDAQIDEGATGGVFIGELLTALGFHYVSFDIVEAPRCLYFDLNSDRVPSRFRGAFDAVLNFGTTEHVLNQYNAFKTIHDFTKTGGLIYSYIIRAGYPDHGLIHYSDRFIDLLGAFNKYEQVWRYDHNVPNNECSWHIVKKTSSGAFVPPLDVQLGDGLPVLMNRRESLPSRVWAKLRWLLSRIWAKLRS